MNFGAVIHSALPGGWIHKNEAGVAQHDDHPETDFFPQLIFINAVSLHKYRLFRTGAIQHELHYSVGSILGGVTPPSKQSPIMRKRFAGKDLQILFSLFNSTRDQSILMDLGARIFNITRN
ncbi:MAG TPA: hypothetical protein VNQ76_21625 [Planctomicrobium sp.]|nr:hypothetical protein [Planctomicrobium sp.]